MRRVQEKLKSRSGVSILFALLLFLVASMVSVIIISASVTAVRRIRDDRIQEQNYLAIASAARVLKESIESSKVVIHERTTKVVLDDTIDFETTYELVGNTGTEGPLGDYLLNQVDTLNGMALSFDHKAYCLGTILKKLSDHGDAFNEATSTLKTPSGGGIRVRVDGVEALKEQAVMDYTMTLAKSGSGISLAANYGIDGVLTFPGEEQKIYVTAWVPVVQVKSETRVTEEPERKDKDGNIIEHKRVTTTTDVTTTLEWTVRMSMKAPVTGGGGA